MPRLYWAGPPPTAARDKCDWIVESLKTNRTWYSKRVKVLDVHEEHVRLERELNLPPFDPGSLLASTHSADHIQAVRDGSSSESSANERLYDRSLGYVETLRMAAAEVWSADRGTSAKIVGSLGGGMHHARAAARVNGQAFNGLALVARVLAESSYSGSPVLILDLDGSCGGGTAALISDVPRIRLIDIAVNETDAYEDTANSSLRIVSKASDYLAVLRETLGRLNVAKEQLPVCIYSAGVDGHEHALGGLPGLTADLLAERDRIVFEWCCRVGIRTAYTTGGGEVSETLSQESLVALHRRTIETAAEIASKK